MREVTQQEFFHEMYSRNLDVQPRVDESTLRDPYGQARSVWTLRNRAFFGESLAASATGRLPARYFLTDEHDAIGQHDATISDYRLTEWRYSFDPSPRSAKWRVHCRDGLEPISVHATRVDAIAAIDRYRQGDERRAACK